MLQESKTERLVHLEKRTDDVLSGFPFQQIVQRHEKKFQPLRHVPVISRIVRVSFAQSALIRVSAAVKFSVRFLSYLKCERPGHKAPER